MWIASPHASLRSSAPLKGILMFGLSLSLTLSTSWCSSVSSVSAQVTLTTANDTQYEVQVGRAGELSSPAVWGDWPQLCVRLACPNEACAPCGALDIYNVGGQTSALELNGRQRRLATQSLHGVEVTRRVFVPSSGQANSDGFARFFDTFHNPGSTPITLSLRLGSVNALGSVGGADSRVWRTSSYEAEVSVEDRWLVIDDQNATAGDESVAILLTGAGGRLPDRLLYGLAEAGREGALYWGYDEVTIAPHTSVSLLTVVVTEPSREDVIDEVQSLLRFRLEEVGFGLSEAERERVLNVDLNPFNAAPLADLNGPYNNALEGEVLAVSGVRSFDLEGFPLTYAWDLNNNGVFGEAGAESAGANTQVTFDRDGDYPIALRVTDHQQKTDVDRVIVRVRNGAPVISSVPTNSPINEGERLTVQVNATDPGPFDVLSYAFDWEGTGELSEPGPASSSRRYVSDGSFTASVEVRDEDGGLSTLTFPVEVLNLPPVLQQVVANNPSPEGRDVTFSVSAVDPGADPILYEFDFEDDGVIDRVSAQPSVTHRFDEDGTYNVRVWAVDDAGARSSLVYPLSVLNVPPTINGVDVAGTIVPTPREGEPTRFTVLASDQGPQDQLTYEYDLDGEPGFELSTTSSVFTYTFPDNLRREVTVRVTDDEGASATSRLLLEVQNQPPTGALHFEGESVREGAVVTVDQNQPFESVVVANDPSVIDQASLTYVWDLNGDGIYERSSTGPRLPMRFEREGNYTIRCLVRDKDLGELLLTREVSVSGRPPVLTSFELLDPPPYSEGQPLRFKVTATDPDAISYLFDFDGDGVFEVTSDTPEVRHALPDEGFYEVHARAQDASGFVEASLTLQVANVAPSIEIDTGEAVGEGEDLEITITARDPGPQDLVTLVVDLQGQEQVIELMPGASRRFTLPTQDNGLISVIVNAQDEDGADAEEASALALVQNRPPFLPAFSPQPAVEGSPYQQVIPADDPAGINDTLFFSLIDPPLGVEIDERSGLLLWTATYQDYLNSPVTFQLVIEDEDGGRLERDIAIDVLPRDVDQDGLPDTYELQTCERFSPCLDPTNPDDADLDSDQDGRGALEEWAEGSDPFTYEGPEVPRLLSPVEGEQVRSSEVRLEVAFVESNRPLPLSDTGELEAREVMLEYEVYANPDLTTLVVSSGWVPQRAISAQELTAWVVTAPLEEDTRYWWRARAQDGPSVSAWSEASVFRLNALNLPPHPPTLALPLSASVVSDFTPTLTFYPSTDPDGDEVYFVVRLYRESAMGPIPEGGGQVSYEGGDPAEPLAFEPSTRLQENARYQWEVVAIDEDGLSSEPSERWGFTVDLENEAPSNPEIFSPLPDSVISTRRPTVQAGGSVDQEGAQVSYHFEVRVYGADEVLSATPPEGVFPEGAVAEWVPDVDLLEDERHVVSVYTSDSLSSSQLITSAFTVSATDNPPSIPQLLEPADGALIPAERAILIWGPSVDPEGGQVSYQVQLCDQRQQCLTSDLITERRFAISELIPAQEVHLWRVSAFDEAGNTLGPSAVRRVAILGESSSAASEGCAQGTSPRQPRAPFTPLALFTLLGLAWSLAGRRWARRLADHPPHA